MERKKYAAEFKREAVRLASQAGVSRANVLQEMVAWESEGMVRRNAHLAPAHLAEHAERIAGLIGGTDLAQPAKEKGPSES